MDYNIRKMVREDARAVSHEDVKTKTNSGETTNNGKGISIGYTESDDTYQYQVLRLYK